MTKQELEATWVPRIGEKATVELRRFRRVGMIAIVTWLALAVAAGVAFTGDTPDKILGVALVAGMVGAFAAFIHCQRKLAAAISGWFDIKISGGRLPKMNPKRFDAWCQERDLRHSDERFANGDVAPSSETTPRRPR
jgi:hypothetical protein